MDGYVQKADCNMVTHGIAAMHRDSVVTVRSDLNVVDRRIGNVGRLMVKIRYSELPAGLHVAAKSDSKGAVVYLQPGLTPAQRRAALLQVRRSARMGQAPTLPRPAMVRALAADRVRTNAHIGAAAARRHPMLFLPPLIALAVSATAFVFMSIQPLTVANQGSLSNGLSAFFAGGTPLPRTSSHAEHHPQPRQHHHRAAASPLTDPRLVQSAPSPASMCAVPQASSGRQPWLRPPTHPTSSSAMSRCARPANMQRWAPMHRY
jgi:hypothetical protein